MGNNIRLSAVVTCFNNEDTIVDCVNSLGFADEVVVLDSFSSDNTLSLLAELDCTVHQQTFAGYAEQKQHAINCAKHDWVVLLDSDEFFAPEAQQQLVAWMASKPRHDAYQMPRREWVFWQWSHPWVRMNRFVRLFNRNKAQMSESLVHESIKTSGSLGDLQVVIHHKGERSLALKMQKTNTYAQLGAQQKFDRGKRVLLLTVLLYPLWYFFRQYVIKRQLFNGAAGLINALLNSHYAFLKYAKLYELQRKSDDP